MNVALLVLLAALLGLVGGLWLQRRRQHLPALSEADKVAESGALPGRAATLDALGRYLSLADRLGFPVVVMAIEIDGSTRHPAPINPPNVLTVAACLRGRLRTHDWLGHWGPGQFVAVLPDTDVAHALVLAEDLHELLAQHPHTPCSISVGLHGRAPGPDMRALDLTASMVVAAQRALEATAAHGPGRIEIEP